MIHVTNLTPPGSGNPTVGKNQFLARAVAQGETSISVARHLWTYDTYPPLAKITSDTKNATKVNKRTTITFLLAVNDTEPNFLPFSDVAAIDVKFSRVSDSAFSPAPLFDFTRVVGLNGRVVALTTGCQTGCHQLNVF